MPIRLFSPLAAFVLCLSLGLASAWAHTGHKEEPVQAPGFSGGESIYAAEPEEEKTNGELFDSSTSDLFEQAPNHDKMEMPMESGHMDHDMKHAPAVKLSKYQWVPTSQKGYALAAGFTVLSGLVFGALGIFRPFE